MASAQRGHGVVCALAALAFVVCLSPLQSVHGQTFSDDFNDGNDVGWTRYNVLAQVGFPATYSFPNGGYRMETPQNWTNAQLGFRPRGFDGEWVELHRLPHCARCDRLD